MLLRPKEQLQEGNDDNVSVTKHNPWGARSGLYGGCPIGVLSIHFFKTNIELNSDLAPCDFWPFPILKRELRGKKFRSDQRSAARFREMGGAL
jgi:hypothetical protein